MIFESNYMSLLTNTLIYFFNALYGKKTNIINKNTTMKKTMTLFAVLLISVATLAQTNYEKAMIKNLQAMKDAKSVSDWQDIANGFGRIGSMEKEEWLPSYHQAFSYIIMSTIETEAAKKDKFLDSAQESIDAMKNMETDESEVMALQGFLHTMRMLVDPTTRGQQYSGLSMAALAKAKKLNPENPRAAYMLAQMAYGQAQFFGSSTDDACNAMKEAITKFDNFKLASDIAPNWGRKQAEGILKNCQ